jgi:hypothetical protein
MMKSASERWKRRVGTLHWETTTDDEFVQFSSYMHSTPLDTDVDTPAALEHGTSVAWKLIVMLCGLISMGLVIKRGWHEKERIPTTNRVTVSLLSGCLYNTGATCTTVDKSQDSETCSRNEADDERPDQLTGTPVATDTLPPEASTGNENNVIELARRLETPPVPVADRTEAMATACTSMSKMSSTLGVTVHTFVHDDDKTNKASCWRGRPASIVSRQSIVAAAEDAVNLAQKIQVTQAVFFQHGLDPSLASEWAMRRQASGLSVSTLCLCV